MNNTEILNEVNNLLEKLIYYRQALHSIAEVGFELEKTRDFIKKELLSLGLEPKECGKCGLTVTIGENTEKCFLLRADMDALPIKEKTGLPFSAKENMHACGHDMHSAMLLGVANVFSKNRNLLGGSVKLMFQPAEEILSGAFDMIKSGALQNPPVQAGAMLHVLSAEKLPAGTVIVSSEGVSAPAAAFFKITVIGKACHGSRINEGIDPIIPCSHIISALDSFKAKEVSNSDGFVLSIGKINAGFAPNILPEQCVVEGSIRCYDENLLESAKSRINDLCKNIASAFRAEAVTEWTVTCPALLNDKALSDLFHKTALSLFEKDKVFLSSDFKGGENGSEDFAFVSRAIPSIMVALSATNSVGGEIFPLHNPRVVFDESVLTAGTALFAAAAINWLNENN